MRSRRDVLRTAGLGAPTFLLPAWATAETGQPKPFTQPLRVPAVALPVRRDATTDYYRLTMRPSAARILPGVRTAVWAYEGQFPGPTIRATRGRRVVVTQVNGLPKPTVVHLHGAHTAARHDGYPMDMIMPGESRDYVYENRQPGATLWYHDHAHHAEAEQVYKGLAGVYLLTDPAEREFGLPDGEFDIPLVVRDAEFDAKGAMVFRAKGALKRNTLLVNGVAQPYAPVAARRYRFRFVNASNERNFDLRLSDGGPIQLIGSDGGLLPQPVTVSRFELWPGERVEAVIDFARYPVGARVVLRNEDGDRPSNQQLLRFDVVRHAPDHSRVPSKLRPLPDLGTPTAHRTVKLSYDRGTGMFLLDGKLFDPNRVDQHVRLGATEMWTFASVDKPPTTHNMHIHLVQFQVQDRNGKPVGGHETGLKDTVSVPKGGNVRVKVRFTGHTGRYVYHCHQLRHSAMGMMAQFEVRP